MGNAVGNLLTDREQWLFTNRNAREFERLLWTQDPVTRALHVGRLVFWTRCSSAFVTYENSYLADAPEASLVSLSVAIPRAAVMDCPVLALGAVLAPAAAAPTTPGAADPNLEKGALAITLGSVFVGMRSENEAHVFAAIERRFELWLNHASHVLGHRLATPFCVPTRLRSKLPHSFVLDYDCHGTFPLEYFLRSGEELAAFSGLHKQWLFLLLLAALRQAAAAHVPLDAVLTTDLTPTPLGTRLFLAGIGTTGNLLGYLSRQQASVIWDLVFARTYCVPVLETPAERPHAAVFTTDDGNPFAKTYRKRPLHEYESDTMSSFKCTDCSVPPETFVDYDVLMEGPSYLLNNDQRVYDQGVFAAGCVAARLFSSCPTSQLFDILAILQLKGPPVATTAPGEFDRRIPARVLAVLHSTCKENAWGLEGLLVNCLQPDPTRRPRINALLEEYAGMIPKYLTEQYLPFSILTLHPAFAFPLCKAVLLRGLVAFHVRELVAELPEAKEGTDRLLSLVGLRKVNARVMHESYDRFVAHRRVYPRLRQICATWRLCEDHLDQWNWAAGGEVWRRLQEMWSALEEAMSSGADCHTDMYTFCEHIEPYVWQPFHDPPAREPVNHPDLTAKARSELFALELVPCVAKIAVASGDAYRQLDVALAFLVEVLIEAANDGDGMLREEVAKMIGVAAPYASTPCLCEQVSPVLLGYLSGALPAIFAIAAVLIERKCFTYADFLLEAAAGVYCQHDPHYLLAYATLRHRRGHKLETLPHHVKKVLTTNLHLYNPELLSHLVPHIVSFDFLRNDILDTVCDPATFSVRHVPWFFECMKLSLTHKDAFRQQLEKAAAIIEAKEGALFIIMPLVNILAQACAAMVPPPYEYVADLLWWLQRVPGLTSDELRSFFESTFVTPEAQLRFTAWYELQPPRADLVTKPPDLRLDLSALLKHIRSSQSNYKWSLSVPYASYKSECRFSGEIVEELLMKHCRELLDLDPPGRIVSYDLVSHPLQLPPASIESDEPREVPMRSAPSGEWLSWIDLKTESTTQSFVAQLVASGSTIGHMVTLHALRKSRLLVCLKNKLAIQGLVYDLSDPLHWQLLKVFNVEGCFCLCATPLERCYMGLENGEVMTCSLCTPTVSMQSVVSVMAGSVESGTPVCVAATDNHGAKENLIVVMDNGIVRHTTWESGMEQHMTIPTAAGPPMSAKVIGPAAMAVLTSTGSLVVLDLQRLAVRDWLIVPPEKGAIVAVERWALNVVVLAVCIRLEGQWWPLVELYNVESRRLVAVLRPHETRVAMGDTRTRRSAPPSLDELPRLQTGTASLLPSPTEIGEWPSLGLAVCRTGLALFHTRGGGLHVWRWAASFASALAELAASGQTPPTLDAHGANARELLGEEAHYTLLDGVLVLDAWKRDAAGGRFLGATAFLDSCTAVLDTLSGELLLHKL